MFGSYVGFGVKPAVETVVGVAGEWDQATRRYLDPRDTDMISIPLFLGRDFPGDWPISPGGALNWDWTPGILAGLPTGAVAGGRIAFRKALPSHQAGWLTPEPLQLLWCHPFCLASASGWVG